MVIRENEGGLVVVDRTQKGDCRKLTANQEGSLEYERSHCLSIILQVVQNSATREARIFTTQGYQSPSSPEED